MSRNQPSAKPTRKVGAATAAGAFVTVVAYLFEANGVRLPADVVAAATTLAVFVGGWLVAERDE